MRILFVSPIAQIGGAERCLLTMLDSLRRADDDLDLHVLAFEDGPLLAEALRRQASTHVLPLPPGLAALGEGAGRSPLRLLQMAGGLVALPGFARRLRRLLRRVRPDIVHSNGMRAHLLCASARPAAPLLWHLHDFPSSRRMFRPLLLRYAPRTAGMIAISNAVAADARGLFPAARVETVLNAVDLQRFHPDRSGDDAATEPAVVRVGLAATYARWKGQDVFLQAIAQLPRDLPAKFSIIGGPIYKTAGSQFSPEELSDLANRLGVGDRVEFLPFQSDMPGVYRSLDVVVHASTLPEPFGLTIAEAMACGRATIVSQAGGAAELFEDGVDAIGVPPGDAAALARAIARLVGDAALRRRLAAAAAESAQRRFDASRIGPQLLTIYRTLAFPASSA
jgi:glycosyltransferase involved in cell wall biosynthesis